MIQDVAQLTLFSLVFMRMSGFVLFNPVFGRKNVPGYIKAGLIMVLAFSAYSISSTSFIQIPAAFEYGILLLKEFTLGYLLGFVMQLFLFVVNYGGGILDFQMGLSMAAMYDPQTNSQIAITGNLFNMYLILLFFATDGHLALMKIILLSAQAVPYGEVALGADITEAVIKIFTEAVVMGIKFVFPILFIEFLSEIGMGILMKVVPQINVFIVNVQLKTLIGLVMLILLTLPIQEFLENVVTTMLVTIQDMLELAG